MTVKFRGSARSRFTHAAAGVVAVVAMVGGASPHAAMAVSTTTTVSYTGPAVPIPDAADLSGTLPGAPATATIPVAGLAGTITDVDLRIDGDACSATAGSTSVGIDHTFANDLDVSLTSPAGDTILLINNTDGGGNNFCQTLLDDESAGASIQSVATANAPFTGSFTPNLPLSGFGGDDANGNWTLSVQDFFSSDVGNIRAFSVIITTTTTNTLSCTKSVAGTFEENGTITYTANVGNDGNVASLDNPGDEFTDVLPAGLTLVSATADSGTAVATIGTNTVSWNGSIAAAGLATITINATVDVGAENSTISNQANCAGDLDVDGTADATIVSDDPFTQLVDDATSFDVAANPPTLTVEQAAGQTDPTSATPILFDVVFSEPVIGFDAADVTLGGTAGATTVLVSGSGDTYLITVSGMTGDGTVTAAVGADVAQDAAGNLNTASTSEDNTVTYVVPIVTTTTSTTTTTTSTTLPPSTTSTIVLPSTTATWDPLESTCRHASLSIL